MKIKRAKKRHRVPKQSTISYPCSIRRFKLSHVATVTRFPFERGTIQSTLVGKSVAIGSWGGRFSRKISEGERHTCVTEGNEMMVLTGDRYVSSRCSAVSRYLSRQGRSPSLSDMGGCGGRQRALRRQHCHPTTPNRIPAAVVSKPPRLCPEADRRASVHRNQATCGQDGARCSTGEMETTPRC